MRLLVAILATALIVAAESSLETLIVDSLTEILILTNETIPKIASFNGSSLEGTIPIDSATSQVISAIQNSTKAVQANPDTLSNAAAEAIGPNTQALAYTVNASVATLIRKKPQFAMVKALPFVVLSLQQQANASNNFSSVVLGKIPTGLRPFAEAINSQLSDSIQLGIECFNGRNESCNPNVVNASRTYDYAVEIGAIPKSDAYHAESVAGWLVILSCASMAFMFGF